MRYLDVCSGISAPTQAWKSLGWECAGYFEIDPFASEVLAARFPGVVNHGDLLEVDHATIGERVGPVDLLVSGSPCVGFSIAGRRGGLDDARSAGPLWASFALARAVGARWIVWENVPGVLSDDHGRTFRRIIATLDDLGYSACWRVLDARFFGVPQRRRRVFIVGYLGDWRPPAAVLFEPESLRRNLAESRKAGTRTARCLATGSGTSGGGYRGDGDTETLIPMLAAPLRAGSEGKGWCDDLDSATFLPHLAEPLTAHDGCTYSHAGNNPVPRNVVPFDPTQITHPENRNRADPGDPSPPVVAHGRGVHVATFQESGWGWWNEDDTAQTVRNGDGSGGGDARNSTVVAFQESQSGFRETYEHPTLDSNNGSRRHHGVVQCVSGEIAHTLRADGFDASEDGTGRGQPIVNSPACMARRLTPRECERLMGCEDDFTLIARKGGKPAADGPRYKALGNSMAVPVMRWIGERLQLVDALWEGLTWKP